MKKRSKLLDNPPEYGGPLWEACIEAIQLINKYREDASK